MRVHLSSLAIGLSFFLVRAHAIASGSLGSLQPQSFENRHLQSTKSSRSVLTDDGEYYKRNSLPNAKTETDPLLLEQ